MAGLTSTGADAAAAQLVPLAKRQDASDQMRKSDAGFSITESVFDRLEMARVCRAIETAAVPRTKAGVRHLLRVSAVQALAVHSDLVSLARTFIGEEPIPFRAT